ncbi:MBL fold metallo-hydrolase [Streptomyces hirsutus]
MISHDHYDHLDLPTVKALAGTDTLFAVPLGVGAHLEHWGVSADRLRELDWHEATGIGGLTLTATPARHFCGRGLRNTQHTLWASWVVAGEEHRVYHSGDTGYFDGFKDIGATHGPFDATMIQIEVLGLLAQGELEPIPGPGSWPEIHMNPAEGLPGPPRPPAGPAGRGPPADPLGHLQPGTAPVGGARRVDDGCGRRGRAARRLPVPGLPFEPAGELPAEPWWRGVGHVPSRKSACPTPSRTPPTRAWTWWGRGEPWP